MQLRSLGVYCGSSPGLLPIYRETAHALGVQLAREGIVLVYGGGNVGLMGVVADGALAEGGKVIGVIPDSLKLKEVAHGGLTELHVVKCMHERKKVIADLSDAFLALPGGVGTIEEILEAFTWSQLGIHAKPCALLNTAGYYDLLIRFLHYTAEQRFLKGDYLGSLIVEADVTSALAQIRAYAPIIADKWIDRE